MAASKCQANVQATIAQNHNMQRVQTILSPFNYSFKQIHVLLAQQQHVMPTGGTCARIAVVMVIWEKPKAIYKLNHTTLMMVISVRHNEI